jgi:hypothetical protein
MLSHGLVQHGSLHLYVLVSASVGFTDGPRITHVFSALCIHTIHFCRTTGTTKSLAEHRAKLCLLGLQELQKSWDLKNWVLDLFFRCIDDNTARDLRLPDSSNSNRNSMPNEIDPEHDIGHSENLGPASTPPSHMVTGHDPGFGGSGTPSRSLQTPQRHLMDATADVEWPGFFNFSDDFADVLGISPTNPDSLNPQNLAFLYRFL